MAKRGPTPCKPVGLAPDNRPVARSILWGLSSAARTPVLQTGNIGSTPIVSTIRGRSTVASARRCQRRYEGSILSVRSNFGRIAQWQQRAAHNSLVLRSIRSAPTKKNFAGDAAIRRASYARPFWIDTRACDYGCRIEESGVLARPITWRPLVQIQLLLPFCRGMQHELRDSLLSIVTAVRSVKSVVPRSAQLV